MDQVIIGNSFLKKFYISLTEVTLFKKFIYYIYIFFADASELAVDVILNYCV